MNSNNNNIIYCEIKHSYRENKKQNLKTVSATEYASWMLETNRLSSRYEVIQPNKKVKFYFDVEKLPDIENTQHVMIHEIRIAISRFFQERTKHSIGSYIITHNKGSETHPGASYHLIFDQVVAYPRVIFEFAKEFIENYPQYKQFIDCCVYSKNRLFKSAYNIGINASRSNLSKNPENYHYFLEEKQIMDNLLRSIITYVSDPSKCFEVKEGMFQSQHRNKSFFANISKTEDEETQEQQIEDNEEYTDESLLSNIEEIQKLQGNKSKQELENIIRKFVAMPDEIDMICSQIQDNNPHFISILKKALNVKIPNHFILISKVMQIYTSYCQLPLYRRLIRNYASFDNQFRICFANDESFPINFDLFLVCIDPHRIQKVIEVLNDYEEQAIFTMLLFIKEVINRRSIKFNDTLTKCSFIEEFLINQTSNIAYYCQMLDIMGKFKQIDELNAQSQKWTIPEMIQSINEIVQKAITDSKYNLYKQYEFFRSQKKI